MLAGGEDEWMQLALWLGLRAFLGGDARDASKPQSVCAPSVHAWKRVEWRATFQEPGSQSHLTFKVYRTDVFADCAAGWAHSFLGSSYLIAQGTLAHSGSRFYLTPCRGAVIKTLPRGQVKFLRRHLSTLLAHLQRHPATLLARFYGLFRVQKYSAATRDTCCISRPRRRLQTVYLLVMQNGILPGSQLHLDLKAWGLLHPRDTKDWRVLRERVLNGQPLTVTADPLVSGKSLEKLWSQFQEDLKLLARVLGSNDYSLLLSCRPMDCSPPCSVADTASSSLVTLVAGDTVWSICIIDILSPWSGWRCLGWLLMPGIWLYFPRFMRPVVYAERMKKTMAHLAGSP